MGSFNMEAIKETVQSVMRVLGAQKDTSPEDNIEAYLKKALTRKELGHIKFHYFRKGILGIKVDSSPRLYHLSLQKKALLAKLRRQLKTLKDIHFCIGEIK